MKSDQRLEVVKVVASKLLLVLCVSYILVNTGRAIQENYRVNQSVRHLKEDIESLQMQIASVEARIAYYQSDSFRELEARRRLGLRRPDETVVLVPENSGNSIVVNQQPQNPAPTRQPQPKLEELSFFERASQNALSWWDWIVDAGDSLKP